MTDKLAQDVALSSNLRETFRSKRNGQLTAATKDARLDAEDHKLRS